MAAGITGVVVQPVTEIHAVVGVLLCMDLLQTKQAEQKEKEELFFQNPECLEWLILFFFIREISAFHIVGILFHRVLNIIK